MNGSTNAVAVDVAHRKTLVHNALTCKGRVAVHENRNDAVQQRWLYCVLFGAHHSENHAVHRLKVARVGGKFDVYRVAVRRYIRAMRPEVVLHVSASLHGIGAQVTFELLEELRIVFAHHVDEHVESTTVGHTEHSAVHAIVGRQAQDLVDHRNHRLRTFEPEPFRADVLGGQELLKSLGRIQALENTELLIERGCERDAFHFGLNPLLFSGGLDVHIFDSDGAAICISQHAQKFVELHLGATSDAAGQEFSLEIPDSDAVSRWVQFGWQHWLFPVQRVEICDEVAANTMHSHECAHLHLLVHERLFTVQWTDVGAPFDRLIRNIKATEDRIEEFVLTEQTFMNMLQECAAFGALNDAVVVRAGDCVNFGNAQSIQRCFVTALKFSWVVDCTDTHDDTLTGHETRH